MGQENTGKRIVVVGGVACGPKAAARARRCDPDADITIVDSGEYISYAGCGMPFYVAGAVKTLDGLMTTSSGAVRDAEFFKNVKNIKARTGTLAESIDRDKKEVTVSDMSNGQKETIPYDKLVIATGARPVVPPIEGIDMKNVFTLHNLNQAEAILNYINETDAERITIIGGGLIGVEVADAMSAQAVDTTIVEMEDHILPGLLDPEMAEYLEEQIKPHLEEIKSSTKVLKLEGDSDGKVTKVITSDGEIETDFVVVAAGVRPNVDLADAAGLDITEGSAIAVNEHMQTSDPDIYAGGDCVESTHIVCGKKAFIPLGSTANRHGRVIGINITGGDETFPGVVGTAVVKVLGMNVGKTGLTEKQALENGFKPVASFSASGDRAHFYPGGKRILIKLIGDADSGKLLGAQIVGQGEMSKRIDVAATALTFGATVEDVSKLDLGYAPPFSTAMDNITHSANIVRNKVDGTARTITPATLREKIGTDDDFIILDIRSTEEFEKTKIEDKRVKNIPMEEIRGRLDELPKDTPIITICAIGLRSYEVQTALSGAGFSDASFMEGGLAMWYQ